MGDSAKTNGMNPALAEAGPGGSVVLTSPRERFLEWLSNKLDDFFYWLNRVGARRPWIGGVIRILFLMALCVGLVWGLIQFERRAQLRLVPETEAAPGAPSARPWNLWLDDARAMAAQGLWREAIHFVYWAAISRLESSRLWPADRARTPREYLRLLAHDDPRGPKLTALTRSFERTWYGGRNAGPSDYRSALSLAAELGAQ